MDVSADEQIIMERFARKTDIVGGPRPGYVLRRQAVGYGQEPDFDLEGGIATLVEKGLLTTSEGGDYVYLTEQGVDQLAGAGS